MLALTTGAQIVATLNAPGTFDFTGQPGRYSLAIIADPAGTDGEGLLGIEVSGGPTDTIIYEDTAAVGADFVSRQVVVTGSLGVDVTATDLGFPGDFESLRIAVTRGATRAGEIIGGGTFSFDATPGTYFVNLLATPDAATGHSTLGLNVRVTPPSPVVSLTASAASVVVGGRLTLTWTATNATGCMASGTWTGSRQASGSETVGPLNTTATFTLTCTGQGGSDAATVSITITPETRSGGGAIGVWMLALLGLFAAVRPRHSLKCHLHSTPTT
jgi:hypothetical protein